MNSLGDGGLVRRLRWAFLGALAACLLLPGVAAATDSVVMFSDPGEYIGQGEQRLFHEDNASVTVRNGSSGIVEVSVSGGTHGDSYSLDFAAPPGEDLRPGVYEGAQRAAFRQSGRAGIDVSGDGRGCNTVAGRFEVKDFERAADGSVQRLWIVFEQHCEGSPPALFGEVRLGLSDPHPTAVGLPQHVRWPSVALGGTSTAVPVSLVATGSQPVVVREVGLEGEHAGDFSVRSDECTARTVGPGEACQVWLRAAPAAAGERLGRLVLVDDTGTRHVVVLKVTALPGRTRVLLRSDHDDFVGAGRDWLYTPADSTFAVTGTRSHVRFRVFGPGGDYWDANFEAPGGDILAPGRYTGATRYPFNETGAGLDVAGQGRGCNRLDGEFTVTEATFGSDGSPKTFGVVFEQRCQEGEGGAFRGAMEFGVDDSTPAPDVPAGSKAPGEEASPAPDLDPAPVPTPTPVSPAPPGPLVTPAAGLLTAKLALARATINRRDRVLDVLAPITSLASGRVDVEVHAAGRRFRFSAPVNSRDGRVRFRKRIPRGQADLGTGIVTIAYPGDEDTRPQEVRLRAASQKANLELQRPVIEDGRLKAQGTVSDRARGLVRLQLQYVVDGQTETVKLRGRIDDGRWKIDAALSAEVREAIARRTGTVHSYTLFTGYYPRRVRGEMRSFQVLGPR